MTFFISTTQITIIQFPTARFSQACLTDRNDVTLIECIIYLIEHCYIIIQPCHCIEKKITDGCLVLIWPQQMWFKYLRVHMFLLAAHINEFFLIGFYRFLISETPMLFLAVANILRRAFINKRLNFYQLYLMIFQAKENLRGLRILINLAKKTPMELWKMNYEKTWIVCSIRKYLSMTLKLVVWYTEKCWIDKLSLFFSLLQISKIKR